MIDRWFICVLLMCVCPYLCIQMGTDPESTPSLTSASHTALRAQLVGDGGEVGISYTKEFFPARER